MAIRQLSPVITWNIIFVTDGAMITTYSFSTIGKRPILLRTRHNHIFRQMKNLFGRHCVHTKYVFRVSSAPHLSREVCANTVYYLRSDR